MKKTNYLFAGIIVFLLVLGTTYFALDMSTPVGISETALDSGMGGGDTRLPTFRPDKEISEITLPPLDYIVYSVKKGDMVGEIASRYGVSQDAIISLNKLRNTRTLQIGQLLKIPSMDGIVYTPKKGAANHQLNAVNPKSIMLSLKLILILFLSSRLYNHIRSIFHLLKPKNM